MTGAGNTTASRRRRSSSVNTAVLAAGLHRRIRSSVSLPSGCRRWHCKCPHSPVVTSGTHQAGTAAAQSLPARQRRYVVSTGSSSVSAKCAGTTCGCRSSGLRPKALIEFMQSCRAKPACEALPWQPHTLAQRPDTHLHQHLQCRRRPAQVFNRDRQQPVTQFVAVSAACIQYRHGPATAMHVRSAYS